MIADLVRLVRPGQWPKNLLVVPLALFGTAPTAGSLARVAWAVVVFTLASSLVYICNDIVDRHRDRAHPTKRNRPIAAGRVGRVAAVCFAATVAALLGVACAAAPQVPWWPVVAYLALNVAYSRWLKHIPLVDVFVVAAGFVLRVVQGTLAAHALPSSWLLVSVFSLCLLLIVGKRRNEMAVADREHRPALAGYSGQYLEYLMVLCSVLTTTTFLLYLSSVRFAAPYTDGAVLFTVLFATFALARYLQLVVVHRDGADPVSTLLGDRVLVVNGLLWMVALALTVTVARYSIPLHLFG